MKKVLLSTIVLTAFSFSIILFQISCKKEANAVAQTNVATQQSKIIYLKEFYGSGNTHFDHGEIWSANYDGTSQQKISITLPTNVVIALVAPKVSPDGKTLFFNAFLTDGTDDVSTGWSLYACDIDGGNVHQVVAGSGNSVTIAAAY